MPIENHQENCQHCGGGFIADVASSMIAAQLCRIADELSDIRAGFSDAGGAPMGQKCPHGQLLGEEQGA